MAVPSYQDFMKPLLQMADGRVIATKEAAENMADHFGLNAEERAMHTPDGGEPLYYNRTHWAVTYLVKAGLLERPKRGHITLTPAGKSLLLENPTRINTALLRRYPQFVAFLKAGQPREGMVPAAPSTGAVDSSETLLTPQERIAEAFAQIEADLRDKLLESTRALRPSTFERLIVELMLKMGYGAGGHGQRLGGAGDGGVDGIISEDHLGLDVVYLQAKRYAADNVIGPALVREFIGALSIKRASKGVFITTSSFTAAARREAEQANQRLILIDGERLAELMIRHHVGVVTQSSFAIKDIDLNYFADA